MKKLIAISVIFALVAGAAFAQVSATVETRFSLLKGMATDGDKPVTGGSIGAAHLQFSGQSDDGTIGGTFRWRNTDVVGSAGWFHRVFVWWRPIQEVRIFLGIDNDGKFDTADIAGWSFHQGDNDYMFNHHWDFWRQVFPGNWDGFGLAIELFPIEGFNFNIVVPTGKMNWPQATNGQVTNTAPLEEMYPFGLRFQGSYNLDGIGKIQFAYNLQDKDQAYYSTAPYAAVTHLGRFGASFLLTSIDNLNVLLGGSVLIPKDDYKADIFFGAAVTYDSGDFGVKVRGAANMRPDETLFFNANVMPFYKLPAATIFCDIGMSMHEDDMGWFLTPVVRMPIAGGAGKFSIGLQFSSNIQMGGNVSITGVEDIKYNIPMLLSFNF